MKFPLRYAVIAISSVSFSGAALASTSATADGPGSSNMVNESTRMSMSSMNDNQIGVSNMNDQSAVSGSVQAGGNTNAGGWSGGDWSSMNPMTWQQNGRGSSGWWSQLMGGMGQNNQWGGNDNSWTPSGDNWQSDWSNWDPKMWRDNGSTYGNWLTQVMPYLNSHYNQWMNGWSGGNTSVGSLSSGDATNTNATTTAVNVDNGGSNLSDHAMMMPANNDIRLSANGPDSRNDVRVSSDFRSTTTNVNDVMVTNSNNQSARSGDVSASRNTWVGNLMSGPASNDNRTATGVDVQN